MLFERVDNIFDLYPEALVHPVSCVGVCHDPLSNRIKKMWPDYYSFYKRECIRKNLAIGQAIPYQVITLFGTQCIITLTIRKIWYEKRDENNIRDAFSALMECCRTIKVSVLAIPLIEGVTEDWLQNALAKAYEKNGKGETERLKIYLFEFSS